MSQGGRDSHFALIYIFKVDKITKMLCYILIQHFYSEQAQDSVEEV